MKEKEFIFHNVSINESLHTLTHCLAGILVTQNTEHRTRTVQYQCYLTSSTRICSRKRNLALYLVTVDSSYVCMSSREYEEVQVLSRATRSEER